MNAISPHMRGVLLLLLSNVCFCTTGTTQALAPDGATPPIIGGLRLLVGSAALLIWCAATGNLPKLTGWPWKRVLGASCCFALLQIIFFWAMRLTGVAVGAMVAAGCVPIFGGLFSWLFFAEKPQRIWYPATALGVAGVVILSVGEPLQVNLLGIALALLSGLCSLGQFMFSKSLLTGRKPETVMCLQFVIAAILCLPVFFFYPVAWVFTGPGLLTSLYLGVVPSALAYCLTLSGMKITPLPVVVALVLCDPLGQTLLGIFLLGEPMTPPIACGTFLIFAGMVMLSVPRPKLFRGRRG